MESTVLGKKDKPKDISHASFLLEEWEEEMEPEPEPEPEPTPIVDTTPEKAEPAPAITELPDTGAELWVVALLVIFGIGAGIALYQYKK